MPYPAEGGNTEGSSPFEGADCPFEILAVKDLFGKGILVELRATERTRDGTERNSIQTGFAAISPLDFLTPWANAVDRVPLRF